MKKIRHGTFETNSSSTHAIVVPKNVKEEDYTLYDSLEHNYGFGREEYHLCNYWDEKLAYTYLALKYLASSTQLEQFKNDVKEIYDKLVSKLDYKNYFSINDFFNYLDSDREDGNITGEDKVLVISEYNGKYIDHLYELKDTGFIERVLNDKDFLKRFLFNKGSYITIGGDEYSGYYIKTIGFEYDYDEHYYVNEKGERPPKEWFDDNGCIKDEYWDKYYEEYNIVAGGFWDKLKEYEKDNDVFLKGN